MIGSPLDIDVYYIIPQVFFGPMLLEMVDHIVQMSCLPLQGITIHHELFVSIIKAAQVIW